MSRIVNTGICSFGLSGRVFHAPFIQANPDFKLSAIVERTKNLSREKYPDSKLYRSIEELIADKDIELIVVNTPVQTHYAYTKAALLAGKNVIVEKPFTVTEAEAVELDKLAKEKNLLLTVYQNRRYDGDYLAVRDVVAENMLGELKEVEMRFDRYRPMATGKDHKEGKEPGSGGLHDLGTHLIDQAIQLFGFPEGVFADILTMRQDVDSNDYFEILLYYPRPFRVRIQSSVFVREPYYAYILQGENGTFMQERSDLQEQKLSTGSIPSVSTWIHTPDNFDGMLHTTLNGKEVRRSTRSEIGNYMNYYEDIYMALVHKRKNPVPASEAILTMRIVDAAINSNKERRVIAVRH